MNNLKTKDLVKRIKLIRKSRNMWHIVGQSRSQKFIIPVGKMKETKISKIENLLLSLWPKQ